MPLSNASTLENPTSAAGMWEASAKHSPAWGFLGQLGSRNLSDRVNAGRPARL